MEKLFTRSIYGFCLAVFLVVASGQGAHLHLLGRISAYHAQIREEWGEIEKVQEITRLIDGIILRMQEVQEEGETGDPSDFSAVLVGARERLIVLRQSNIKSTSQLPEHYQREEAFLAKALRVLDQLIKDFDRGAAFVTPGQVEVQLGLLTEVRNDVNELRWYCESAMDRAIAQADRNLDKVRGISFVLAGILALILAGFLVWFSILLHRLARQRIQHEKIVSVGLMASQLAHEIRNPLSIIKSAASVLGRGKATPEEAKEMTGYLADEVERIDHLITDLLQLRHSAPAVMNPGNISRIVGAVIDFIQPKIAERNVEVHFHDRSGDVTVLCDENGVRQLALNLIINALDATPDNGAIEVETMLQNGDFRLLVRDYGGGISPQVRARLFEPFLTTKKNGLGIGLSVVKRVADDHGARVEVETAPGGGTVFVVSFPLCANSQGNRDA